MSIKLFTQVFVCSAMFSIAGVALSCSQGEKSRADLIISRLSSSNSIVDSIKSIREIEITAEDTDAILKSIADSSTHFKALTLAAVLSYEDIAKYILANPSRDLITATGEYIFKFDGGDNMVTYASTFDSTFKSLTPREQAIFLTQIATPDECADNLENNDTELKAEIIKIYESYSDKSALNLFNQSLKQNN